MTGLTLINLQVEISQFFTCAQTYSEGTSECIFVLLEASKKLKARVEKNMLVKRERTNVDNTAKKSNKHHKLLYYTKI